MKTFLRVSHSLSSNHLQPINFVHFTAEQPLSTQVLIYINVCRAMDMGIRFFVGSKPSPSLTKAADLYSLDSDPPPSSDREIPSAISSHHKNSLIWFVTPGNEAGLLPPECFSNVELVRIKRRILWTPVEGVLERERIKRRS